MENYFKFYGLQEHFFIDERVLKQKYLTISKENHPDFFIADEQKYNEALELTSTNNKAYKTLKSFNNRVKHILELFETLKESKNEIPQDFLFEMMEINETIMDLKIKPNADKQSELFNEVETLESKLNNEMEAKAKKYDASDRIGENQPLLENIKEIYLKLKYVLRIKESVNTFASF